MKIVTVVGARPQFIKAAAVSAAIKSTEGLEEIIVHTGQHYDANMSNVFFDELGIRSPKHELNLGGGSHGSMTGRMLEAIEEILILERPDILLVYGDTNSTLAGALAAVKLHIPVAHVEAGLRSFNLRMPEEVNRILTDHCSQLLFCPTDAAVDQVKNEKIQGQAYNSGDVMYDITLICRKKFGSHSKIMDENDLTSGKYVLATCHRAENTDSPDNLKGILEGLNEIAGVLKVVLPLHPRTRMAIHAQNMEHLLDKILVMEPLSFVDVMILEMNAKVIVTDSGGMQKEAYFHGVPCVTMREETEWRETVEAGWNIIAGANKIKIVEAYYESLKTAITTNPQPAFYGNGNASIYICQVIRSHLTTS